MPLPEDKQRELGGQLCELYRPMDVSIFARKALDQMARNRAIIVVPWWCKIFWCIDRASPTLAAFLMRRSCHLMFLLSIANWFSGVNRDRPKSYLGIGAFNLVRANAYRECGG